MPSKTLTSRRAKVGGSWTDASLAIPDGASHQVLAANPNRHYLLIQAPKANTASFWFNENIAAVAGPPSIEVPPQGAFVFESTFVLTGAINIIGTTADNYVIKEG